ncbi:hypothetical protein GCM10010954_23880 [Halobacillus andaensis]|uniref:Uncharacterized protein n=1 Tax=Halobacillus andaensis TaxID=1176239 RepID=A0A917EVY6_HALAA|nr:hypothetical protein [Halobacillus andaensis]MBP2006022.1 hypothetical protein [Halobacillus andaensis]GGF24220.1 hypothetical protein GCM10010954_23880 [Halobacillus andaensis]
MDQDTSQAWENLIISLINATNCYDVECSGKGAMDVWSELLSSLSAETLKDLTTKFSDTEPQGLLSDVRTAVYEEIEERSNILT